MAERLTKEDIRKIEEEIEYRKLKVRPEILDEVKEARAQGDLSENFEYKAAKQAKRQNDGRIRYLENMLKHAIIIEDHSRTDEIGLNNYVTLYFEDEDEEERIKLVTSIRGNSRERRISIESPLGKAIRGHKVGEWVTVQVNEKVSYDVQILKIEEDDGADDDIRKY